MIVVQSLKYPSLTCQWFKGKASTASSQLSSQRILIGTHSDGNDNQLIIQEVKLPTESTPIDIRTYKDTSSPFGGFSSHDTSIATIASFDHPGEVNSAKYMPQKDSYIATKTNTGTVLLYNHIPNQQKLKYSGKPIYQLTGHTDEGFGLEWCPKKSGRLLSAGNDKLIAMWDIESLVVSSSSSAKPMVVTLDGDDDEESPTATNSQSSLQSIQPNQLYKFHKDVVEDIAWSPDYEWFFISVSDDQSFAIWDTRTPLKPVIIKEKAHSDDINCVDFSPFNPFCFATGSSDTKANLWDMRNYSKPWHILESHTKPIYRLKFNPVNEPLLATGGTDHRIHVWDLSRIGLDQDVQDAADGPSELLFIHGGHTSEISDFDWNPNDDGLSIISTSDNGVLQIWKMAGNIQYFDDPTDPYETEIKFETSSSATHTSPLLSKH